MILYLIAVLFPNKEQICFLNQSHTHELSLRFNEMSEFHITIPYLIDGEVFPYYDRVLSKKLILIDDIGYFLITEVNETDDGIVKQKTVTAYSLETELAFKKLNLQRKISPCALVAIRSKNTISQKFKYRNLLQRSISISSKVHLP